MRVWCEPPRVGGLFLMQSASALQAAVAPVAERGQIEAVNDIADGFALSPAVGFGSCRLITDILRAASLLPQLQRFHDDAPVAVIEYTCVQSNR